MFNQHLYTRSNIRMGGFQTIAHSGLPNDVLSILEKNAKYLSQQGINELDYKPKIRYSFTEKDTYITGQSVYGLSDGRMAPLTHNFTTQIDSLDCSNLDHFAGNLHFIETFGEENEVNLQPSTFGVENDFDLQNFISENPYGIDQSMLSNIVIDLLKVIDEKKGRKIYLSLDVPIETQTNAALAILQAIYSLLPAGVRPLVGYNTFFMGDINNELYHPNIQLYFVPRHILNSSKRIYGKKINVDIIYAVESKYFDKINQDTFAFQRIWQVVPDTLSDFYDLFDTVIGDEAVNRYGYLGCLEQLSPVSHSNDCKHEEVVENILSRLVFISTWVDAHGIYEIKSAHIAKLLHDYSQYLKDNQFIPDKSIIFAFIEEMDKGTLTREDVIQLLDLGLKNAKGAIRSIIELVSATKNNIKLYNELFLSSIVNDTLLLQNYLKYELGNPSTMSQLLDKVLSLQATIDVFTIGSKVDTVLQRLAYDLYSEYDLLELDEELAREVARDAILKKYYYQFIYCKLKNLKTITLEELSLTALETFYALPLNYPEECKNTLASILELQELYDNFPNFGQGEIEQFKDTARCLKRYETYIIQLYSYYDKQNFELSSKLKYLTALIANKTIADFYDEFLPSADFKAYLKCLEWLTNFDLHTHGKFERVVSSFKKNYLTSLVQVLEFSDFLERHTVDFNITRATLADTSYSFIYELELQNKLSLKEKAEYKFKREYQDYKKKIFKDVETPSSNTASLGESENSRHSRSKSRSKKEGNSSFFGLPFGKRKNK